MFEHAVLARIRGAISGALKNKRGLTIQSEMHDGRGRIYRIV